MILKKLQSARGFCKGPDTRTMVQGQDGFRLYWVRATWEKPKQTQKSSRNLQKVPCHYNMFISSKQPWVHFHLFETCSWVTYDAWLHELHKILHTSIPFDSQ